MQRHFGLYHVPDDANFGSWSSSPSTCTASRSWACSTCTASTSRPSRYRRRGAGTWRRWSASRSTTLLIQGITRLFAIRETVQDAVAAVMADPDIAVRVGRRAVDALIAKLQDPLPLGAGAWPRRWAAPGPPRRRPAGAAPWTPTAACGRRRPRRWGRARAAWAWPDRGAGRPEAAVRETSRGRAGGAGRPRGRRRARPPASADPDEGVRLAAVQALVRLGGEEARGLLLDVLHDAGQPRAVVLRVNELLGPGQRDLLGGTPTWCRLAAVGTGFGAAWSKWVRPGRRKFDSRVIDLEVGSTRPRRWANWATGAPSLRCCGRCKTAARRARCGRRPPRPWASSATSAPSRAARRGTYRKEKSGRRAAGPRGELQNSAPPAAGRRPLTAADGLATERDPGPGGSRSS